MHDKLETVCLLVLVPLTFFIVPPSLISIVIGVIGMIQDLLNPAPPNTYPAQSVAPAYAFLPLMFLVPLALLWGLFYLAVHKGHK